MPPSFSMVRLISNVDKEEPDLKFKHLLIRAPPCSPSASLADPALGKVKLTVEVEEEPSDTIVTPLERVVTEAAVAVADSGLRVGRLTKENEGT